MVKTLLTLVLLAAAWLSGAAFAQNWIHFTPTEGDFRVLFPAPPTRNNVPTGGVEFRAEGGDHRYSIFRHNPGQVNNINDARELITKRVVGEDRRSRGADDGDLAPNEVAFRVGRVESLHRVILEQGRYYELVVQVDGDDRLSRQSARDFFSSFQMGAGGTYALLRNLPTPESCAARGNVYMQRFCEYLTCLAPGQESNRICVALPRLRR